MHRFTLATKAVIGWSLMERFVEFASTWASSAFTMHTDACNRRVEIKTVPQQASNLLSNHNVTLHQHLLSFALLALLLRTRHEDHVVDLAEGPRQVGDFLLRRVLRDSRQVNQTIGDRRVQGGWGRRLLLLLGGRRLGGLETAFQVSQSDTFAFFVKL